MGPLQTAFGFHLFTIGLVTASGVTQLEDVREEIISTLRAEQTIDALYDKVNLLEDTLGGGDTIEEAIDEAGGRLDIAAILIGRANNDGLPVDGAASELLNEAILDLFGTVN